MKIYNGYLRNIALAIFFSLTATLLSLYGCGGGGGDPVPPVPVPGAPSNLIANAGNNSVTLSWSPVAGATSYNIYRGTALGVTKTNGTKVSGVQSPNTVSGLTNGTAYYFVVTAVNAAGESGISAEKTATPSATPPPAAPGGVTATPGNAQVTVSWSAVAGATSYNLYWATASGAVKATGTKIAGVTSPKDVTGLVNGTKYYFVVTAVNANGESAESAEVSATPTATGTSKVITAFSFATPAATGTITEATHTVAVTVPAGTNVTSLTPTITHTGATISPASGVAQNFTNPVTYTVTAADSSTQAYEVTVTVTSTAPAAPTGVTATPGNGQVTISWNAVSGATSYNIYWSTTSGVTKTNGKKFTGVVSPQLLTNLTSGITYYFVVTAVNAYGESGESSQVNSGPSPGTLRVLPGWGLMGCIDTYIGKSFVTPQTLMAAGGSPFAYYQWDSFGFPMGTTVSPFSGVFSSNGGQLSGKSQESVTIKVYDGTQTATGNAILNVTTISSAPVNGIPGVPCPTALLSQYPSGSFALDGAVANKPYGATLFATGGTPPYSWSEDTSYSGSGDFHLSGLTIDNIHGLVRGTVTNSSSGKTLRFKVIVKDSTGETAIYDPVYSIAVQ